MLRNDEVRMTPIELRASRDLSLKLGAAGARDNRTHRQFRDQGDLLVREPRQPWLAAFWRWQITPQEMAAARLTTMSSQ
jgi:hypothetical protein